MNEKQQIIYMQARIIRLASEEWNEPVEKITELFVKHSVLQYIEQCFDIFHLEGDEAVLEDVTSYLDKRGCKIDAKVEG